MFDERDAELGLNDYGAYTDCTTCKLDSGAIEDYGRWMERGNPLFGLDYYPAHTRKDEVRSRETKPLSPLLHSNSSLRSSTCFSLHSSQPTEDEDELAAKARMLIDDVTLDYKTVDYAAHTVCAAPSGVTTVSPIYNVSLYTSALPELDKEDDYTAGINSGYTSISFTTTQASGSPLTTENFDLKNSTNTNFFQTADTWSVVVDDSVTPDGNPLVQAWKLRLEPEAFNLGSTLLHFEMGDADIKFTFTTVKFVHCPYR